MELRMTFTLPALGSDPDNGERFMNAFMEVYPEGGPSVAQHFEDKTLTVTFAVDLPGAAASVSYPDADALRRAVDDVTEIFIRGLARAGFPQHELAGVKAEVVSPEPDREPIPA